MVVVDRANLTQSSQQRKYLGDSNDLHFVPKSPIVDRQKLSAEDEDALKQACIEALSSIPHSDEMTDDPFRYLASQIIVKQPREQVEKEQVAGLIKQPEVSQTEWPGSSGNNTATPSDTSKRETIQTNATTPLTTPGVTPGEAGKRFSDAGKRPTTAQPSHLRTELKKSKGTAVYSFLKENPIARPQTANATKSLTHLPSLAKQKSKTKEFDPVEQSTAISLGQPDFNKSLPDLPKVAKENRTITDNLPKEKSKGGISRMLKTVRLPRTQPLPPFEQRSKSTDLSRKQQAAHDHSKSGRQPKFALSLFFHRRNAPPERTTIG
ncbi:hypothetical protein LTR05_000865 [Lithohypha guttulata]|uniref:Uncharacterized protein n=1 Tax=Lithohypha guttulata TaxID=1690604 RepID=A0AAN7YA00_9EURO|nr:hypothetical protein LTR05_000865 [Lithohypha guttulata]